jgi:hypothetical protein
MVGKLSGHGGEVPLGTTEKILHSRLFTIAASIQRRENFSRPVRDCVHL